MRIHAVLSATPHELHHPITKVLCSALLLIGCVSQTQGPYIMLEVTLVRATLPPPSLSRVSQKVWGRATPPPCQGRGSHSHSIPHAEMTWHLLFNSYFNKGLQLHKIASCIHKFIFPYSSVLQGVHSFPSLFCTFCSTSS